MGPRIDGQGQGWQSHTRALPRARLGAAVPTEKSVGSLEQGDRCPLWDEPLWGDVVPSTEKHLPPLMRQEPSESNCLPGPSPARHPAFRGAIYCLSDRRGSQLLVRVTQSHSQKRN